MPTTYTNGLKLPDLGSIDWYNSYKNNIDILDPIVGTVNGVATTYAPISHNHSASEITSGTIDIARLPPAALERMHIVADQTARYALTTSTVQEGDTVKQTDTGVMYLVVDSTKLNSADGYTEYSAGTASKAIADEDGTSIKTGYVNVAGNQTVSGNKEFTGSNTFNNILPNATNTYSLGSSSYQWSSVYAQTYYYNGTAWGLDQANVWTGANTFSAGVLTTTVETSPGNTGLVIRSTDQTWESGARIFLYSNTQTGQTNGSIYVDVDHGDNGNTKTGLTLVPNAFHPIGGTVNTTYGVSLGTATYQWAKVYSEQYYYNGTAWGLDKDNTWTGANSFTSVLKQRINSVYSQIPANDRFAVHEFIGTDDNRIFTVNCADRSSGQREMSLLVYDTDGTFQASGLFKESDNSFSFRPRNNNTVNLGNSTNKWKTLNGVNPGALSLPDYSSLIDVSGSIVPPSGETTINYSGGYNEFTPSVDGWLSIRLDGASFLQIYRNIYNCPGTTVTESSGTRKLVTTLPVRANVTYTIVMEGNPTNTKFHLYPMLGNV